MTKGGGIAVRAESGPWVVLLGKLLGEDLLLDGYLVLRAEAVYLDTAPVTDSDMEHVRVLANVEKLSLKGTQVTDAGLVHLRGLKQLAELKLDNTPITDAGLVHLRGLTNLTLLSLRGTKVTDTGVAELQKALPNVQIQR